MYWEDLDLQFWLVAFSCALGYNTVLSFQSVSGKLLQRRFGFSTTEAGKLLTLIYMIPAFCNVLIAYISQKLTRKAPIIVFSGYMALLAHFILLVLPDCEKCWISLLPLLLLGLVLSIYSCVGFAFISFFVPERSLGIACGIIVILQNFIGMLSSPVIGLI